MRDLERVEHAISGDEPPGEIVRYDKAGKWYIEWPGRSLMPCQRVSVREAARTALHWEANGGTIFPQQYGGRAFIREVQKLREADQ